tara:strand:- start:210 stop:533 length:324 start_codon:yes stop_codon:yes gene_type:complete
MVKVGQTVYNRYTGKKGILTTICKKSHLKDLRIKYQDGQVRYHLKHDITTQRPSVLKARPIMDNLTSEQLERVKKTAEMVGLPLRETAQEMAAAGLLEVQREEGGDD